MHNMKKKLENWQILYENLTREKGFRIEQREPGKIRIISSDPEQIRRISVFLETLTPEIFEQTRVLQLNPEHAPAPLLSSASASSRSRYPAPKIDDATTALNIFSNMFEEDVFATLNLDRIFATTNPREPKNVMQFVDGRLISIAMDAKFVREIWLQMLKNIYNAHNGVTLEEAQGSLHGEKLSYKEVELRGKQIKTFLTECFFQYAFVDQQTQVERVRVVVDIVRYKNFLWATPVPQTQEIQEYVATVETEASMAYYRQLSGGTLFEIVDSGPHQPNLHVSPLVLSNTPPIAPQDKFVVLADISGSMSGSLAELYQCLYQMRDFFLKEFPRARLEVVLFDEKIQHHFKYQSIKPNELESDIASASIVADKNTALCQAVLQMLTAIYEAELTEPCHTNFFVVTDGEESVLNQDAIPPVLDEIESALSNFEQSSRSRPGVHSVGVGKHYKTSEVAKKLLIDLAAKTNSNHYEVEKLVQMLAALLSEENRRKMATNRQVLDLLIATEAREFSYHIPVEPTGEPQRPEIIVPVPKNTPFRVKIGQSQFTATVNTANMLSSAVPALPQATPSVSSMTALAATNAAPLNVGIKFDDLQMGAELGRGGFGRVVRATYNGTEVAVKCLLGSLNADALSELEQEAKLMNRVARCDFVVQLIGVCLEQPNICLVMEYMAGGDLYHLLGSSEVLSWEQRYDFGIDIAKGLSYLHGHNILHRDLKSLNVLLTVDHKHAKISDFGLGLAKTQTMATLAVQTNNHYGTPYWMAPEALAATGAVYSRETDVYSFGIILLELAIREIPWSGVVPAVALDAVKRGERPIIPDTTPKDFAVFITRCWAQRSGDRPDAKAAVVALEECKLALAGPKL